MKRFRLYPLIVFALVGTLFAEPADLPTPRTHSHSWMSIDKWREIHDADLARANEGSINVLFLGDSITEGWEQAGKELWEEKFVPLNAANFGIGGDTTQNLLWRITDGNALNGVNPQLVVLLIGTNNLSISNHSPEATLGGIKAIVNTLHTERPNAKVLLLDVFPRGEPGDQMRTKVIEVNRLLELYALENSKISRLRIWDEFLSADGVLAPEIMPDKLHLTSRGYEIWANAMLPTLQRLLSHP